MMWYVVLSRKKRGIKMNDQDGKKKDWKTCLAILISLGALWFSYQANINSNEANVIAKQAQYNQEHPDVIAAKNIQDNTCIELDIYSQIKELKDNQNRSERIIIYLHNSMPKGLEGVEYDVITPNKTNIQNIQYSPDYVVNNNPLAKNYSIFSWGRAIKVNKTVVLGFDLTWNKNDIPLDFIGHKNLSFTYYVGDIPINKIKNETLGNRAEYEAHLPDIRNGCQVIN